MAQMPQPRSLLLIEDDETTLAILTVLLQQDGWTVTGAPSGEDALSLLASAAAPPQIILCDQNLPGIEGPPLAAALRATSTPERLIAMSASLTERTPDGYDALLSKPFGPQQLHEALQELSTASPAPAAPAAQVLSTRTHDQLAKQMGPAARDLYQFALADAEKRVQQMDSAARGSDLDLFRREAHALKGSAGMIGAEQLAELASRAETAPDLPQHQLLEEMRFACAEIRRMLERLYPA